MPTNADRIIQALQDAGVRRLFGMPGGGSNADLIEAAAHAGLPFTLAHTETASAFMAAAQAEITGQPGACLATLGPGAASLMNGVANAYLERVPLIVLTDCQSDATMQHQNIPHGAMFRSLVKWTARPGADEICDALRNMLDAVSSLPPGPVHLDTSTAVTSAEACAHSAPPLVPRAQPGASIPDDVRRMLLASRRPAFLIGLGARTNALASALRRLCEQFGIPALVTYKAKGVVPDSHPWFGGVFTNGSLERDVLDRADLLLAAGLDPVELLPRPWKLPQPVISLTRWPMRQEHIPVTAQLTGDEAATLEALPFGVSDWDGGELRILVDAQRDRMRPWGDGLLPHRVAELVAEAYPGARIAVDAGAHMFPVMALWPAQKPCGVLISNGLSTMGFAVPAAIGAALLEPGEPVVAFTGDGGMLMCLAELITAAREKLRLRVIVFDDAALTLIKIKQEQRGFQESGVAIGQVDWRSVATGLGVCARHADSDETLRACLRETADHAGPVLIAAKIDPRTYVDIMQALRG